VRKNSKKPDPEELTSDPDDDANNVRKSIQNFEDMTLV
jgi:hypothetical protein